MDNTICPYCGKPLEPGRIYAIKSTVPFWLPQGAQLEEFILSGKAINNAKGRVIGKVSKIGFYQKKCVLTGFCERCNVLITFMDRL